KGTGLEPIFPVWGLPTRALAEEMIASGLRAKLTCVDTEKLDVSFVGREFNSALLSALPPEADPCGENGEFHSFVYAGPMLSSPILISLGDTLVRERFAYADLIWIELQRAWKSMSEQQKAQVSKSRGLNHELSPFLPRSMQDLKVNLAANY